MNVYSFSQSFALAALTTVLAASASAKCTAINVPEPVRDLEEFKASVVNGDYNVAMLNFEISDAAKQQIAGGLEAIAPDGFKECTTIKRVRQSDYFISEVFMTEFDGTILYWTISGQTDGSSFRMINFTYHDEFEKIRGLIH